MAPKKKTSPLSPPSFPVGNCEVIVEAKKFVPEFTHNSLQITLSKNVKIKISVVEEEQCRNRSDNAPALGSEENGEYYFVLVNPKDSDDNTKYLVQFLHCYRTVRMRVDNGISKLLKCAYSKEVLDLYSKELPAMNFAANTGKESTFLERCVSNGRYCTLVLKYKDSQHVEEVVSAISYQIVPSDTHYAEIPLASVSFKYQKKGIGRLMYMELRERLQRVGIHSIFCWGDQESEGFWLKQGFKVIGEVNKKGRARRLPVKADIRKALCFPGGSTLMVSHLNDSLPSSAEQIKVFLPLKRSEKHHTAQKLRPECMEENTHHIDEEEQIISSTGHSQAENLVTQRFHTDGCQYTDCLKPLDCSNKDNKLEFGKSGQDNTKKCSCSTEGTRKRMWESSLTSLNSKKVKGCHTIECQSDLRDSLPGGDERNCSSNSSSLLCGYKSLMDGAALTIGYLEENHKECTAVNVISEDLGSSKLPSADICFRVMLMNIADEKKKASLTKIIEDLGGIVTSDGGLSTHVVTGKVRRTLNFCTALCSGAWIISPTWLKESFRNGRFVDEMPFVVKDEEYECKYGIDLKVAVHRARASPHSLLKGLDLCLAAHIQPPKATLTAIIMSAGGNVVRGLDKVKEPSSTIFIACEEDMEEALLAVKGGIRTFSSDWLMNSILRQELDLEASQFAESL